MTATRLGYDKKAYLHDLYESKAPQSYLLLPEYNYRSQHSCFQENPEFRPAAGRIFNRNTPRSQITTVESDLRNLDRKASKNPLTEFPFTRKKNLVPEVLPVCSPQATNETKYTQLEAPSYKRELQIDVKRFESLDRNPQRLNRIQDNSYIGENTRLIFRDAHIPQKPMVMDATNRVNYKVGTDCRMPNQPSDRNLSSLNSFFNQAEVNLPWKTCSIKPNAQPKK
jgi:hypothetical protein